MNDRYLILMRHAKSSWANSSLSDFDRPLNDRGRKAVPVMRTWLESQSMIPDGLLCSTATRAQQTAELVSEAWPLPNSKIDLEELYLASPNTILESIQKHGPAESKILLVVGHNPGFEVLASMLSGRALAMPTAAVAIFRCHSQSSWSIDLSEGQVRLDQFMIPRELQPSLDPD